MALLISGMESKNKETDVPEYQRAFTALDELNLASLKPFFKEHFLQDDTLFFMESEEELRNFLIKELNLKFGQGFKFSRHWFNKYHNKHAETLDCQFQTPQRQETPCDINSGKVATTEELRGKNALGNTRSHLKNEHPAQTESSTSVTQVTDESKNITKFKIQPQEQKDEGIKPTKEEESNGSCTGKNTAVSAPILNSSGSLLKEGLLEKQKPTPFQDERSCQICLPEAQEAFSQEVAVFEAEKRNNESGNTYVLEESSQMRVDIHGADANIQDSIAADDISFETCIESQINTEAPEYTQEELPSPPDLISERRVTSKTYEGHYEVRPVDIKTNQIGFLDNYDRIASPKASDCRKEGTDENLTLLGAGTENDLKTEFVGNDQLEQETYKMEQSNENLRTSQKFATDLTDNKAEGFYDIPVGEYPEEMACQNSSTSTSCGLETAATDPRKNAASGNDEIDKDLDAITDSRKASDNDEEAANQKASDCSEGGTDENVTILDVGAKIDIKTEFLRNDQLEQETYKMGKSNESLRTNQKDASEEIAEGSIDIPIRDYQEEMAGQNSSTSTVNRLETAAGLREDVMSGNHQIDTELDTTTNERRGSDYENQLKGDITAKECKEQEQDTKVTATTEEVVVTTNPVLYCREEETCRSEQTVDLFIEKTNRSRSFPESVGSGKEEHHCSKGKKKWNKTKVQGSQKTEKLRKEEEEESLEDNSFPSSDSDPCPQGDEQILDEKQETMSSDVLKEDWITDINNNTYTTKIDASWVAVSALPTAEPLAAKQEISSTENWQTTKEDGNDGGDTSSGQRISSETSSKRGRPEEKSFLPETENHQEFSDVVNKCTPRPLGVKGKELSYQKGFVIDAEENREVEFKSLISAQRSSLPWKIMEKAKKFICACLNADSKGIIYFGVGDSQEQNSKFKRGEILGLDVEGIIDDITKAFQFVLDDHIKSDAGPLQKGGEQNCVNLEFVPVLNEGGHTNLYVIEIEVIRDWKFCKDNVYYCKCWTEKRGVKMDKDTSTKKALSDFYKVHKDEFDDVAIRTNGASTSVKQHEVNRQVKEPLMAKHKEWKRAAKSGPSESQEDPIPDDSDVKRFSGLVRERFRDLNFKDFGYVLIANKLPPQYRWTPHLAFLQNIPWLAVFDLFDAASKKGGLHYVCNETTDAPRAKLRSLDDFKEVSSDWIPGKDFNLSTRGTTWILSNEEMQEADWIKCSRDCFYRALSTYKLCFPPGRLLCVFLGLDETGVQEMVDMMECCFSILGNSASNCVTIISESRHVTEAFIKASKLPRELRECSITGIPWKLLKEIVREMVGPTKFEERGATTKLPYFTGQLKDVLNKVIHSWDDLEVYSPDPRLPSLLEDIEKERNAFYKGAQASQTNLFHNHCIPRTLEEETTGKIEDALKELSKPTKDISCHVKTVTVPYEPGSGATTLCRRILWKKRNDVRCAIVKAITPATDYQIERLQGILYDEKNLKFAPPVMVLVDNFPENETRRLTDKITKRKTKCVILSTFPIAKLSTISDFDVTPLRKLDEKEMHLVKDVLINITSDSERRREAEEVLEREQRFIWFGLELFGRDYEKIEERLQNHIKSTLDFLGDSQEIHEMVLNFCCFLHYYSDGRSILPHPVVSDILYEASNEKDEDCALMQHIHTIFGGLLLEGFNETNGYYGWRPAHSLVSEVVTSRINTEDTAILLMEKIYKGKAYVNKFLKEQVLKVFLDRKRISDPVLMEDPEKDARSIDSDFENEVLGFYEVKTRYSPFIVDILEGDNGIQRALRLLITICQKASEIEEKAYAWQQLARFMGYEMRANEMDKKNEQHHRLHTTMNKEQDVKLPMPKTGIEAAHIAVDIAINEQPNYSHHYVTKGTLYLLQLRDFKTEERAKIARQSMPEVIDICRKALDVYDKALRTTHTLNHYSMIGKIQSTVSLLEIVKGLPSFRLEGESITRYLKQAEIPKEMEGALTQEEHDYVRGLSTKTLGLLNELFGDVKLRHMTSYDENEIRALSNAKIRASKLRRTFYEVTGFDRSELSNVEVPIPLSPLTRDAPALYQQIVQDVLFKHDETPYSSWANLSDGEVSSIYNLLKVLCLRGYGSHDDMLICCKACLRLKERPSVEELDETVSKWVAKYPNSEWAHLFNYMVHFPIPNGSLAAFSNSAKESIKRCDKIVRDKTGIGFRKSGAEYFLGKGIGLYAIASSQEFRGLETKWETKTEFWRSKEISEKLERVCGQKDLNFNGVITYQGIQLRFDNTRYPNQSKDDLWFYVGFSVAGPYAYDPVDKDAYDIMRRKTDESELSDFPSFESANAKDGFGTPVSRKGKFRELKNAFTTDGRRSVEVTHVTEEMSPGDFSFRPLKGKQSFSSSMPHFLNKLPSDPEMVENASASSIPTNFPSAMSTWVSTDSLHQPATSSTRVSYASAVQIGSGPREEERAKTATKQPIGPRNLSAKGHKCKAIEGTRGMQKQLFQPKYVDKAGKLHHGAWVLGAEKSKECRIHTPSQACLISETSRCTFAHSWRGDTLQYVCKKCTREGKGVCRERRMHESYIWNLGPYYKEDGSIWKDSLQELPT